MIDILSRATLVNKEPAVRKLAAQGKLFDFLPEIVKTNKNDLAVLFSWASYFVKSGVPFLITDEGAYYVMWKMRMI